MAVQEETERIKPLPPIPTTEPIPAFSAIEIRLNNAMSENPDILAHLWQARPDEAVVNFPEV